MLQTISIPHWWHTITPTPIGKSQHRGSRETLITTIQFKSPVLVQWIIQHHFFNNHTHLVQMGLKEKPHHPSIQQYTPISYLVVLFAIAEAFSAAKPRMPQQERGIQEGYLNTFMDIKMPLGVLIQHRWKLIWCDIVGNTAKALRLQANLRPPVLSYSLWPCDARLNIIDDQCFYAISCKNMTQELILCFAMGM